MIHIREAGHDESYWITSRTSTTASSEWRGVLAETDDGLTIGMIGLDGWTPNSVVATIALDRPVALRRLLIPTLRCVFETNDRGVILALVMSTNKRSLKLCKHLGLVPVYTIKDGIDVGVDLILHEMRRENCRFLRRKAA